MIRMLLVGYCYSIRSERRLCQEVEMNLAYRWFCRLGLEDRVPDHSTFSVNRHGRFRDSDILRTVFEEVVCTCMGAGLVGGEGFAVDASVIEANASRFARIEGSAVDWTDEQRACRPVQEYLAALESDTPPTNPQRKPKAMSPTDPAAAWTTRGRHKVMFGYSLNYLIDMENAVIVDVEATPTRISKEVDAAETMIGRVAERFALKPDHVAGDVFENEPIKRAIFVERTNDIIPKGPSVPNDLIALETPAFPETNHIEPMPPPVFSITRRGEQALDQLLVGGGRRVVDKLGNLIGGRRQTGQVVGHAPDQGHFVRRRRWA